MALSDAALMETFLCMPSMQHSIGEQVSTLQPSSAVTSREAGDSHLLPMGGPPHSSNQAFLIARHGLLVDLVQCQEPAG